MGNVKFGIDYKPELPTEPQMMNENFFPFTGKLPVKGNLHLWMAPLCFVRLKITNPEGLSVRAASLYWVYQCAL